MHFSCPFPYVIGLYNSIFWNLYLMWIWLTFSYCHTIWVLVIRSQCEWPQWKEVPWFARQSIPVNCMSLNHHKDAFHPTCSSYREILRLLSETEAYGFSTQIWTEFGTAPTECSRVTLWLMRPSLKRWQLLASPLWDVSSKKVSQHAMWKPKLTIERDCTESPI